MVGGVNMVGTGVWRPLPARRSDYLISNIKMINTCGTDQVSCHTQIPHTQGDSLNDHWIIQEGIISFG